MWIYLYMQRHIIYMVGTNTSSAHIWAQGQAWDDNLPVGLLWLYCVSPAEHDTAPKEIRQFLIVNVSKRPVCWRVGRQSTAPSGSAEPFGEELSWRNLDHWGCAQRDVESQVSSSFLASGRSRWAFSSACTLPWPRLKSQKLWAKETFPPYMLCALGLLLQ